MRSSLDKEACSQLMIFPLFGTVVYVTFSVLPQQSEHLATINLYHLTSKVLFCNWFNYRTDRKPAETGAPEKWPL